MGATKKSEKLSPILKWAGGKEQELKHILPAAPASIRNYYEPFVGGGAVYTAIEANSFFINDRSEELITLYREIGKGPRSPFFALCNLLIRDWDQLKLFVEENAAFLLTTYKDYSGDTYPETATLTKFSDFLSLNAAVFSKMFTDSFDGHTSNFLNELQQNLGRKVKRMKQLEREKHALPERDIMDNLETAFKSAFYMHVRYLSNLSAQLNISTAARSALFFFIRNYAYSGMFRYNASGEFNVPYGGIGYNNKMLYKKVEYLQSVPLQQLLSATIIDNLDFEQFLAKHQPGPGDFIFLDPPYDSEFSTYARNEFSRADQERLANYLTKDCVANWMLVIKNTDFIYALYGNKGLNISTFDKKYLVSFMNRNDKSAEHLMISNY